MEITIEFDEKSNLDEVIVAAKASMIEKILKYQDIMEKYQELNTNFSRYMMEHFGVIPRSEYDKAAMKYKLNALQYEGQLRHLGVEL
jgi:hypothetical protein